MGRIIKSEIRMLILTTLVVSFITIFCVGVFLVVGFLFFPQQCCIKKLTSVKKRKKKKKNEKVETRNVFALNKRVFLTLSKRIFI